MSGARLLVCGEQAAGPDLALSVGPGEAIRIYTGAPIPQHADAVIMQEDVDADEKSILVREGVNSGENIRVRGGDLCEGQKVASKGDAPDRAKTGRDRFAGTEPITGFQASSVAIFATGSELRSQGEPLNSGEIYETNRILLAQLVAGSGAEGEVFEIVPDLEEAHLQSFRTSAILRCDRGGGWCLGWREGSGQTDLTKTRSQAGALESGRQTRQTVHVRTTGKHPGLRFAGQSCFSVCDFFALCAAGALEAGWPFLAGIAARAGAS